MKKFLLKLFLPLIVGVLSLIAMKQTTNPIEESFVIIKPREIEEINRQIRFDLGRVAQDAQQNLKTEAQKSYWNGLGRTIIGTVSSLSGRNEYKREFIKFSPKSTQKLPFITDEKKGAPILLVSLHGTFATMEESGTDDAKRNTRAIHEYAQTIANVYTRDVALLIFQWGAENTEESRQLGGLALAKEICEWMRDNNVLSVVGEKKYTDYKDFIENFGNFKFEKAEDPLLFSVTHSWGGAVMQYAAKYVFAETGIDFDLGIQTACPVPHKETIFNNVFRFKKLFQFYSTTDFTQILGSTATLSEVFGRKMPLKIDNDHRVWNIRVQNDGYEINHLNIKWIVMEHAYDFISLIDEHYSSAFNLDANVVSQDNMQKYKQEIAICQKLPHPKPLLIADRSGTFFSNFNTCNRDLFQKIYGFSLDQKSPHVVKQLKTVLGEAWYKIMYEKADSEVKKDMEKPVEDRWIIQIKNNTKEPILVNLNLIGRDAIVQTIGAKGVWYVPVNYKYNVDTLQISSAQSKVTRKPVLVYGDHEKEQLRDNVIEMKEKYGKQEMPAMPAYFIDVTDSSINMKYGEMSLSDVQAAFKKNDKK